jgi:hypothetical protein
MGTQRAEKEADIVPPSSALAVEGITLQRRSDLCITRNKTAWPQPQYLYSYICERFIYLFHDRSTYFAAANKADQSWEYTHRYTNVETSGTEAGQFPFWEYFFLFSVQYPCSVVQLSNNREADTFSALCFLLCELKTQEVHRF